MKNTKEKLVYLQWLREGARYNMNHAFTIIEYTKHRHSYDTLTTEMKNLLYREKYYRNYFNKTSMSYEDYVYYCKECGVEYD